MGGKKINRCTLSEMEKEIIGLLCMEFSNKEIAEKLFRTVHAIERSRERIKKKIGAKNLAGIVNYGNEHGFNPNLKAVMNNIPRKEIIGLKKFVWTTLIDIQKDRMRKDFKFIVLR
jgi:DNA-binding CsgD family transcriptional regulator